MKYPGLLGRRQQARVFLYLGAALLIALLSACTTSAGTSPPATSPPTMTSPATTPASPTSPTPEGTTFQQLADSGKTVSLNSCSKCHGESGQGVTGPALIGSGAHLAKYGDAQQLSDYISTAMPFGAPGSLSSEQYTDVLAYLLVQNNYVSGSAVYSPGELKNISLSK